MQPSDTLTTLFRHHLWANLLIFERCAGLTSEQLDASMPGGFGSIRDTLQHIAMAERSYLARISTGEPYRRPADAPPLSIAELTESLRTTGAGLIEWAPRVQPDDTVIVNREGTQHTVPKSIILTQAINHATEHRAQIMAILTQLGVEPPDADGWSYHRALGG